VLFPCSVLPILRDHVLHVNSVFSPLKSIYNVCQGFLQHIVLDLHDHFLTLDLISSLYCSFQTSYVNDLCYEWLTSFHAQLKTFFSRKEMKVFDENIPGFFSI